MDILYIKLLFCCCWIISKLWWSLRWTIALTGSPWALTPESEMERPGTCSPVSEQQLQRQEGQSKPGEDGAEQSLISSEKWLQRHGLKANKLSLRQILSQIGFPHCEGTVLTAASVVCSSSTEAVSALKLPGSLDLLWSHISIGKKKNVCGPPAYQPENRFPQ